MVVLKLDRLLPLLIRSCRIFKPAVAQEVSGLPGDGGVGEHGGVVDG